jgi:hypothetical protein
MSKKHRDLIAITRDESQHVQVTIGTPTLIGNPTAGGREVDGGYSQLFNRVMQSGIYASLPLPARAVYTALVYFADNQRHFIVDGKDGHGVNIDRIMTVSGCGETAVKQAIKVLSQRQLIRILRKGGSTPDGTRFASIYQMLLPVAGYENLHKNQPISTATPLPGAIPPRHNATRYPSATRPGTGALPDPVPQRLATPNPVAKPSATGAQNVRNNRKTRNQDSSKTSDDVAHDDMELMRMELVKRGVADPLLSRILSEVEPATIQKHVLDFDVRNQLSGGSTKTAGWLVKSILVPYDLHDKTRQRIESVENSKKVQEHHRIRKLEQEHEEAEDRAREQWVDEQFSQCDLEELEALRSRAIQEYGPVARGLDKADPRTHPRLVRLIKAQLSQMYEPSAS